MTNDTAGKIGNRVILFLCIADILLFCYLLHEYPITKERQDEITVKRDTVTIRDTIYEAAPQPTGIKKIGFATAKLPILKDNKADSMPPEADKPTPGAIAEVETEPPDSAAVQIPIEQKHYTGDDYEAWISGWNPSLDSIMIYRQSQLITATTQAATRKPKRWGLSIGAGVVAGPNGGIQPGIFIGASYTFISF